LWVAVAEYLRGPFGAPFFSKSNMQLLQTPTRPPHHCSSVFSPTEQCPDSPRLSSKPISPVSPGYFFMGTASRQSEYQEVSISFGLGQLSNHCGLPILSLWES